MSREDYIISSVMLQEAVNAFAESLDCGNDEDVHCTPNSALHALSSEGMLSVGSVTGGPGGAK